MLQNWMNQWTQSEWAVIDMLTLAAVVKTVVTLMLTLAILRFVRRAILSRFTALDAMQTQVIELLSTIAQLLVCLVGFTMALDQLGFDVRGLLTSLGLSGFALSFAFKDALSNCLAGIMVILYQPFRIGDHIDLKTAQGQVTAISLRYTQLKHESGYYLVPNQLLLTQVLQIKG